MGPRGLSLSHHRAYGSVHGGSVQLSYLPITQSRKAKCVKIGVRQRHGQSTAMTEAPGAVSTPSRTCCQVGTDAPLPQLREAPPPSLPMLPDHATQTPPNPRIQPFQHCWGFTVGKITPPSNQIASDLLYHLLHPYPAGSPRQLPDPRLEPGQSLRRNASSRLLPARDAKPQKRPLPDRSHRAFGLVDPELELLGDEATEPLHHPLAGLASENREASRSSDRAASI